MLVLTRCVGEKVVINGNIVVTLCEIVHRNRVRIGIQAPPDVEIVREELLPDPPKETVS